MSNFTYINKTYCNKIDAKTSVDDRGYQFGDAVYEVIYYRNKKFLDLESHLKRLRNSLKSINISFSISDKSIVLIIKNLIKMNRIFFGSIYIQVSRGIAERDHNFFKLKINPVLLITTKKFKNDFLFRVNPINVITTLDNRWANPDIKTIQLLPNVLAKSLAYENNATEAIFIDNQGYITEGASSNVWMINHENTLITRKLDGHILPGITRQTVLDCANANNINVVEKKFKLKDLISAKEVFITSASSFVTPVKKIDNLEINNGIQSNFSNKLRKMYMNLFD